MKIHYEGNKGKGFLLNDGKTYRNDIIVTMVVDGYHAPLTAGNFVDLVNKQFYDDMPMQSVEQLTVQTGKPLDGKEGYYDKNLNAVRRIPLELFYKKDIAPVYDVTSDDDLRATETMALPFQAYGALGMARENESGSTDTGSSQFFFLKWLQALIPPGRNTLDGFYSCYGYVTNNGDLLGQITLPPSAKIVYAKVIEGSENLYIPK
jgi:peptidylprolyl isomerase